MKRIQLITTLVLLLTLNALSQEKKEGKSWDVSNPEGNWNFKNLKLSTTEGTWMNLDVSPDGNYIVFDLLGDIYKMSINGGTATVLMKPP